MESSNGIDFEKLSLQERQELRQFIANEEQKATIYHSSHELTEMCWKKCVTSPIKSKELDKGEQACLANCVDRFMDVSVLAVKHLQSLRR